MKSKRYLSRLRVPSTQNYCYCQTKEATFNLLAIDFLLHLIGHRYKLITVNRIEFKKNINLQLTYQTYGKIGIVTTDNINNTWSMMNNLGSPLYWYGQNLCDNDHNSCSTWIWTFPNKENRREIPICIWNVHINTQSMEPKCSASRWKVVKQQVML